MEECVLRFTDIDEGGVHSLDHALDAAEVDGAHMALLVGDFEEDLREAIVFGYGNAYLSGCRIDDDVFLHEWVGLPMDPNGRCEAGTRG